MTERKRKREDDEEMEPVSVPSKKAKKSGGSRAAVGRIDDEEDENMNTARRKAKLTKIRADEDAMDNKPEGDGGIVDSDDDEQKEDRAWERYQEAGMDQFDEDGNKIMAFNMREEMDDGYFDGEGNYFVRKDGDAEKDAWMDGLEEEWDARMRENKGNIAAPKAKPSAAPRGAGSDDGGNDDDDDGEAVPDADMQAMKKDLASHLKHGENPLKALRRLKDDKDTFNVVTDLASRLLGAGDFGVYQKTREQLEEEVAREPVAETKKDEIPGCNWEYKFGDADDDDAEVHGPFSSEAMLSWKDWFAKSDTRVSVRLIKGPGATRNPRWVPYGVIDFAEQVKRGN